MKLLRKGVLTEKAVFVDSWPDISAVVIVDSKVRLHHVILFGNLKSINLISNNIIL